MASRRPLCTRRIILAEGRVCPPIEPTSALITDSVTFMVGLLACSPVSTLLRDGEHRGARGRQRDWISEESGGGLSARLVRGGSAGATWGRGPGALFRGCAVARRSAAAIRPWRCCEATGHEASAEFPSPGVEARRARLAQVETQSTRGRALSKMVGPLSAPVEDLASVAPPARMHYRSALA